MGKTFRASVLAKSVLSRLAHPGHVYHALKLHRNGHHKRRTRDNAELALIGRLLPGGFLHFGYFDDPARTPQEISLGDIVRAQARYAHILVEHIKDSPVLDVGCGMGGLIPVLDERGFSTVALTPDRTQAQYVMQTYPHVPLINVKFAEMAAPEYGEHAGRYGAVITAESLQYLKLDQALPLIASLLRPGGRWIACDFFRRCAADTDPNAIDKSGHDWNDFHARLSDQGWRIVHEQDITANVLPTLRCLHMWGAQFGLPVLDYALAKFGRRHPGWHYLLEGGAGRIRQDLSAHLEMINPEKFIREKLYALMVMERV